MNTETVRVVGPKTWGNHPLAHEDGIAVFGAMLSLMGQKVGVACDGCDWKGRRTGFPICHNEKPCPRCGGAVDITDASRKKLLVPVDDPELAAALDKASAEYDATPTHPQGEAGEA